MTERIAVTGQALTIQKNGPQMGAHAVTALTLIVAVVVRLHIDDGHLVPDRSHGQCLTVTQQYVDRVLLIVLDGHQVALLVLLIPVQIRQRVT